MVRDEYFSVLRALGLSVLQARVYVFLLELGRVSAESISMQTRICQLDVEQTLFELQELGLVKKLASNPLFEPPKRR